MNYRHPRSSVREARLSPKRKERFIFFISEGYSQLEACKMLGVSPKDVINERDRDPTFDRRVVNSWKSILFEAENSLINLVREGYWPAVKYLLEARTRTEKEEDKRWSAAESKSQDFEGAKRTLGGMVEVMRENICQYTPEKMREMELSCAGEYAAALEQNRNLFTNLPPMHLKDIDRSAPIAQEPQEEAKN